MAASIARRGAAVVLMLLAAICALWALTNVYVFSVEDPISDEPSKCYADHPLFAFGQLLVAVGAVALCVRAFKTARSPSAAAKSVWIAIGLGVLGLVAWLAFLYGFLPEPQPLRDRCPPQVFY